MGLSRFLQNPTMDLCKATGFIEETLLVLEGKRENASSNFSILFYEISELASKLDTEIRMPRIVARQTQRENVTAKDAEEYYRRVIYIPLLENVVADLKVRLSPNVMGLFKLNIFLPTMTMSLTDESETVKELAVLYQGILPDTSSSLLTEVQLWRAKWKRFIEKNSSDKLPHRLLDIIKQCDSDMYPGINCLLKVLATLPVSIASSERSFSTLRRVKTWLRASMGEDRLVGLALLNVHRDIEVDVNKIINRFSKIKRKLDFVI